MLHYKNPSVYTVERFLSPCFCKSSQMYSLYFFWRGGRGNPETDHEATIIYLLAGFFGSKSQFRFIIYNTPLERLFSAFWKKGVGKALKKTVYATKHYSM